MACAKCDFYTPKQSTAALQLEGKQHLLRLLQEISLGDAKQAAVEEGVSAYEKLLLRLADVPTPAGPLSDRSAPVLYRSLFRNLPYSPPSRNKRRLHLTRGARRRQPSGTLASCPDST